MRFFRAGRSSVAPPYPSEHDAEFQTLQGRLAAIAGLIGRPALTTRTTPAASNFDGKWSVVIITEAGNCDRAYRYPVRVTNGVLTFEGEAAF